MSTYFEDAADHIQKSAKALEEMTAAGPDLSEEATNEIFARAGLNTKVFDGIEDGSHVLVSQIGEVIYITANDGSGLTNVKVTHDAAWRLANFIADAIGGLE